MNHDCRCPPLRFPTFEAMMAEVPNMGVGSWCSPADEILQESHPTTQQSLVNVGQGKSGIRGRAMIAQSSSAPRRSRIRRQQSSLGNSLGPQITMVPGLSPPQQVPEQVREQVPEAPHIHNQSSSVLVLRDETQISPARSFKWGRFWPWCGVCLSPTQPSTAGQGVSTSACHMAQRKPEASPEKQSTVQRATNPIGSTELYHWLTTVGVLLILQFISGSFFQQSQCTPGPFEWSALLLLLFFVTSVFAMHFAPSTRHYAPCVLAFGSLLMTCQSSWHLSSHAAQFKDSLLEQRLWQDKGIHNSTSSANPQPSTSLYGVAFGSSGLEFLDTATLFAILFQNALQSGFNRP